MVWESMNSLNLSRAAIVAKYPRLYWLVYGSHQSNKGNLYLSKTGVTLL